MDRWLYEGQPSLQRFAPYTAHVFKVDPFYYLAMARGSISRERASNRADLAYLYYLPFAMVFISGDRLHMRPDWPSRSGMRVKTWAAGR